MEGQKIVLAGLDQAGKSSIIQRVFFNAYPEDIDHLKATRGIKREQIQLPQQEDQFVFWELGGQQQYLEDYTVKPQIFNGTRLLIFVIDLQDDSRYETAIGYLQEMLKLLRETTHDCQVTIILHKFDPEKAAELRKKQFVIFRLLKSIQSQYPEFNYSQHSTSIYDDTLFYSFQNIFERLGIDIGAYSTKIQTQLSLKDPAKEKTKTREIMSQELLKRFDSIHESAKSATDILAPECTELEGIIKLHQIMEKYFTQFHESVNKEKKRQAIDATIMAYLEFISSLIKKSLETNSISEEEAQMIYLYMGQLNLVKVRYAHYVMRTEPYKISNPLKFMEQLKQLTNDLLDASYIVGNISLQQLQDLKQLFNGVSNKNFSLFALDNQDVYTFTSIQELKSAFSQDKFVPAKMIIKVELAEQLSDAYSTKLEQFATNNDIENNLNTYLKSIEYLILEFYQIVVERDIKEYDIARLVETEFFQLTNQLLSTGNLANIIADDEVLNIRNNIEQQR